MIYKDGAKMSKSKGNVVAPDELVARYGADTLRLYVLFLGPPEDDAEWNDGGIAGCYRFLQRLWTMVGGLARGRRARRPPRRASPAGLSEVGLALARKAHWAIDKSTRDSAERFHFNTAIAAAMELLNETAARRGDAPSPRSSGFAAVGADLADPALRAAHRRGAVVAARRRAAVARALARGRCGLPDARHARDRRPGQRQAARPVLARRPGARTRS